jgi:ribosomal protein L37AE/L43A
MVDNIPEDKQQSFPCEICGGNVILNPNKDWWECDECDFAKTNKR